MTKVKICGLTNLEDASVAVEAGADLLGFIFYEPSPRYVAPEKVKEIVSELRFGSDADFEIQHVQSKVWPIFVGVFVNESPERVAEIVEYCQLDAVQLHGDESPEDVARFERHAYKALRPKSPQEANLLVKRFTQSPNLQYPVSNLQSPASNLQLPAFLLDAYHPTLYGGTGYVTDWDMSANIARQHSIMLAGSLTSTNVVEAIQAVEPWGVDVSSGVEAKKGQKDHDKVRAFVEAVRNIERGT